MSITGVTGGVIDIGFTDFFEDDYLPWLKHQHPASYRDAVSRGKILKEFFGAKKLQDIPTKECERLKQFLKRGNTRRGKPRSGTVRPSRVGLSGTICDEPLRRVSEQTEFMSMTFKT